MFARLVFIIQLLYFKAIYSIRLIDNNTTIVT